MTARLRGREGGGTEGRKDAGRVKRKREITPKFSKVFEGNQKVSRRKFTVHPETNTVSDLSRPREWLLFSPTVSVTSKLNGNKNDGLISTAFKLCRFPTQYGDADLHVARTVEQKGRGRRERGTSRRTSRQQRHLERG
ncbi:hypothetical protein EYF80_022112 [Liparis tanakae]|uniref:Uncharacterized protein n=1 Tax=Liparis tanakae TaxID=230148 RepID=A0A4Z2HPA9_9TELE|nr:hypothetical protein EYF80_022112 [Liparis tanakae]